MKFRYRNEEEMKDSGVEWIGNIPEVWKLKRNKNVFSINKNIVGEMYDNYKILSLTLKGVIERDLSVNAGKIPATFSIYQLVNKDSLLLCLFDMDVTPRIAGYVSKEGIVSSAYTNIEKNIEKACTEYFYYWFLRMDFQKILLSYSKSLRSTLTNDNFMSIQLVIPPFGEQEKIANFLDEKTTQFDTIISKKESLIKTLEQAKKSLISEVVTGKVNVVKTPNGYELVERKKEEMKDSGVEWLGDVPREWSVKRLRFLGDLQNGISKGGDEFGFGYPFVSYGDVYRNMSLISSVKGLVNSTLSDRKVYSVLEGDVFFTRTSESVEEIGFAATCLETINDATFAGFLIRFRPVKEKLYKGFSKYYFRCDLNRRFFVKEMNLVTRASLSQNLLKNLAVPLPPYEEQIEIYLALEYKIGGIDSSMKKLRYQIEKIKEAKQSLISEAVTGKIEILD